VLVSALAQNTLLEPAGSCSKRQKQFSGQKQALGSLSITQVPLLSSTLPAGQAEQVPPEQLPLQHWLFFLHAFPRCALTLVGPSLTDAQRSKRATDDGSPHQPEGLASREGAICQSTGEIVEEAFFCGYPPPLPRKTGLVSPAELRNLVKYEGLQSLAQLRRTP
jgi:hypothetical protein